MKLLRIAAAAAALPWFAGASFGQAELNRMDLNNGGDTLWFVNVAYIGSDPGSGNFNGDLYWKTYPNHAIQRCEGATTLWGVEMNIFDLDWSNFSPLWAYLITTTTAGTSNALFPVLNTDLSGPGVFVPELANTGLTSPSPGSCPKPGYVGGWILSDLFADSATGSLIPLMQASDNGADDYFNTSGPSAGGPNGPDWAFVHFYPGNNQTPGGQNVFAPSPNGCGSGFSGSATFQWLGSTNGAPPLGDGGENAGPMTLAPDGGGTGGVTTGTRSIYGGFQIGGNGAPATPNIPEVQAGGADLEFLMEGAMLSMRVNPQYTNVGAIVPEVGTAGLETPMGWDTASGAPALKDADGGVPGSVNVTLGVALYNQSAATNGTSFGVTSANIDFGGGPNDLLADLGLCFPVLGGDFALNPANPIFNTVFNATLLSFTPFVPDPNNAGERVYLSPQFPLGPDPSLLGVTLAWQGWELAGAGFADTSNIVRHTFRDNSNVQ